MLESFLEIVSQVLILFLLMGVGYLCQRLKFIDQAGNSQITHLLLYVVTPCVVFRAFLISFDAARLRGLLFMLVFACFSMTLAIWLCKLFYRNMPVDKRVVHRYAVIFSNCGFMALPLIEALAGDEGVFYGSIFVIVFQIYTWTYGVRLMDKQGGLNLKKVLLNPSILACVLGLPFFLFSIPLPRVPYTAVDYLASLNTPVAMVVIGVHLGYADIRAAFREKSMFLTSFLRLIAVPSLCLAALWLVSRWFPVSYPLAAAAMVPACAPSAANGTLFATLFERDSLAASQTMAVSTLFSLLTMPLFVGAVSLLF